MSLCSLGVIKRQVSIDDHIGIDERIILGVKPRPVLRDDAGIDFEEIARYHDYFSVRSNLATTIKLDDSLDRLISHVYTRRKTMLGTFPKIFVSNSVSHHQVNKTRLTFKGRSFFTGESGLYLQEERALSSSTIHGSSGVD